MFLWGKVLVMQPSRNASDDSVDASDRPTVPAPAPANTQHVALRPVSMQAPAGTHAARFGAGREVTVDQLADLVWGCSLEGVFDYLGPQWFEYTGIPAEEQLGRSWTDLLHPSDAPRVQEAFRSAASAGAALDVDMRVRRHDGVFRWFRARGRLSTLRAGTRFCGTCTDVEDLYQARQDIRMLTQALSARIVERTEQLLRETKRRERIQTELQRAAARLQLATRAAGIGTWEWNVVDDVLEWDATMYALYGLERAKFASAHEAWQRCLHPEDAESAAQQLLRGLAAESGIETSFRVLGDDGALRHIRAVASVERDATGRVLRVLGANWDVSAQVVSERALLDKNEKLALSNQELEQFAYVASHDLQEPLRAVAGCAQLLRQHCQSKLDADADEIVQNILEGAERMSALIQAILSLSRVSSQAGAFAPVESCPLLHEALRNLGPTIKDSDALITHDELPVVHADPTQLTQLFQNLLSNGIKYRSTRRPELHVSAQSLADGWYFSIRDNGIGIEHQYYERIFRIFQRLHARSKYPGTGIGLAICKKIVERHNGRIWVEATPEVGSTFCFTLKTEPRSVQGGNAERQPNANPAA
jgi:PAS domain S-box-containing protein